MNIIFTSTKDELIAGTNTNFIENADEVFDDSDDIS